VYVAHSARNTVPVAPSEAADLLERAFVGWQSELMGMLYHLVGHAEDARDALQETFVKCWRHREKLEEIDNLKAWVFRVALNTARDLRQTAWRRHRKGLPEDETTIASSEPSSADQVEYSEQLWRLRQAVGELRAEEREVFLLRQNGQLTYEEIAETLGVPTGTVKTRMRLALIRLRETLAQTL
jgi:RNA polymerase sigma factor (sigma-70 family)